MQNLTPVEIYAMGLELGIYGWMIAGLFHSMHEVDTVYWFVALAVVLTRLHARQIQDQEPPEGDDRVSETAVEQPY